MQREEATAKWQEPGQPNGATSGCQSRPNCLSSNSNNNTKKYVAQQVTADASANKSSNDGK